MDLLIATTLVVCLWCLAPLPLAVAIGRAFRDGHKLDARQLEAAVASLGKASSDRTHFRSDSC